MFYISVGYFTCQSHKHPTDISLFRKGRSNKKTKNKTWNVIGPVMSATFKMGQSELCTPHGGHGASWEQYDAASWGVKSFNQFHLLPKPLQYSQCSCHCLNAFSSFLFFLELNPSCCHHLFLLKGFWLVMLYSDQLKVSQIGVFQYGLVRFQSWNLSIRLLCKVNLGLVLTRNKHD